jgi:hypothetical protein
MNVPVEMFQRVAGILPAEILDRSVERMNFRFTYKTRSCEFVFKITEHNTDNTCDHPFERLLNFYSLATVAKLTDTTPEDIVVIDSNLYDQIRAFLTEYAKNNIDRNVNPRIIDFVGIQGGDIYLNPMGTAIELAGSFV